MHTERLLAGADFLQRKGLWEGQKKIPKKEFCMSTWDSSKDPYAEDLVGPTCGTVKCAIGHMTTDPWFRRRGLKLVETWNDCQPQYKEFESFDAVAAFFGITYNDAFKIFGPHTDKTLPQVARELRKYVKDHQ